MKNVFIENSFAITTKLLKKDLRNIRENEPLDGYLNIKINGKESVLFLEADHYDDKYYIKVSYGEKTQSIQLSEEEIRYGTRSYLVCACGCRRTALYWDRDKGKFSCRMCLKIPYASNGINRRSKHGEFLYLHMKSIQMVEKREKIDRIFWRSRYTKPYQSWLKLTAKMGNIENLEAAGMVMSMINDIKKV